MHETPLPKRKTLSVGEAAEALGIGRTLAYEAVRRGEIPTVRIGRRLLVPRAALDRLLNQAATEASQHFVEETPEPPRPHVGSSLTSSTQPNQPEAA